MKFLGSFRYVRDVSLGLNEDELGILDKYLLNASNIVTFGASGHIALHALKTGHAHVTAMLRSRDQLPLLETEGRNAIHKSKLAVNVMIAPDGTNSFCQLFRAFQRHWAAGTVVVLRYVSLPVSFDCLRDRVSRYK